MSYDEITNIALQSAHCELEYERILWRTDSIYEEERARILRVQLLLQEDASDEFRETMEENEDALQRSEDSAKELQDILTGMEEQYESTQSELKACIRDIDQYQAEINAFNISSTDNTKILTEKLALSRELCALKPELEHLRSQVSHHDNILADKLSLERELATVQLELDSEKRTIARLKQRSQSIDPTLAEEIEELKGLLAKERKTISRLEKQNTKRVNEKSAADAALVDELEALKIDLEAAQNRAQDAEQRVKEAEEKHASSSNDVAVLDELRKDLAKERKGAQKLEREQLKKAAEWDGQKEALELKLDAFRSKLRSTKEQLKEAQDELERLEAAKFAGSTAATKARMRGTSVEPIARGATTILGNVKKRPVARFDPDMTIGTPGNGGQATKRQRLTGSMVGDKSTFSITPFLSRTAMSILPESPEVEGEKDAHDKVNEEINTSINELAEEAEREQEAKLDGLAAAKRQAKQTTTSRKTSTDAKEKGSSKKINVANKPAKISALPQVREEHGEQDQPESEQENLTTTTKTTNDPSAMPSESTDSTSIAAQAKKKKILGARRNIFEEEEDNRSAVGKKPVGLGLSKVKLGPGNKRPKVLAVFSPLKKDRMTSGTSMSTVGA